MCRHTRSGLSGIRSVRYRLCLRQTTHIVAMLGLIVLTAPNWANGQQAGEESSYVLVEQAADGVASSRLPWPAAINTPARHAGWKNQLLTWYQERAWFNATVDSLDSDLKTVWVTPGKQVPIDSILVSGEAALWAPDFLDAHLGQPATKERIENVVARLLSEGTSRGYLAASAEVSRLQMGLPGVEVEIRIEKGPVTRLEDVVFEGDSRTRSSAVMPLLGLRSGQSLEGVDLNTVRSLLSSAGLHDQVFAPRYELRSDSGAVLVIPVQPLPPGQFDLVIGALPGSDGSGSRVIGSGHLLLSNAFGRGRTMEARVNRLPGQAASALLSLESPAPFGLPLRIHAGLQGHQQDSTWNQSSARGRIMYRLDGATWVGASFTAERTRAGFSGTEFVGGAQTVPRSSARLGGVTMRISRVDNPRFPRSGFLLESTLERGLRSSRSLEIVGDDTLSVRRSERRERMVLDLDLFLMSGRQLGWAAGMDVSALRAGRPDVSELLFLGGAQSLRGYDENRFRGTAVARAFLEGRWYVDRSSWGFIFFDAGWVAIDADFESNLPLILKESEGFHPGYGFGFVFSSAVGPISLSYALNPEATMSQGRVHIGLSFGL